MSRKTTYCSGVLVFTLCMRVGMIAMPIIFDDVSVLPIVPPGTHQVQAEEEKIEAAFIWQFLQFIEFPASAQQETFVIGCIGSSRVESFLSEIIRQKRLQDGRVIEVRHLNNLDDIGRCHVLFVAPSETAKLTQILNRARGRSILSIGCDDEFLSRGGIMNFYIENTRVRFEYSTEEIANSKLRFSSQLLRHGRQYSKTVKE